GNAIKFYSSVIIEVKKGGSIKFGIDVSGNEIKVKVVKNKFAPPFKQADFDLIYVEGISLEAELSYLGDKYNIIQNSGAWKI
ncbi:DNA recombination/repair protein RecA, partial [Francisella tularensis subsp. holarctica]|nr:DNA recombination/repair protein RecA [Francisella tularensis subsp. holarctica]